jgi:nicotinamidase-related amidase
VWSDLISAEEQAQYERAGWGGTTGVGVSPALVVVDMYRAFVDPDYPFSSRTAPATAEAIAQLLDLFRRHELPVFFTRARHEPTPAGRGRWKVRATVDDPRMRESAAYEIWPSLTPHLGEYVFEKTYPSAFFGTILASQLIFNRVDTVVVVGTVTSGCVRGTALDAFNFNFRVIVPEECVCDRGDVSHKVALFEIHMKYGDVMHLEELMVEIERVAMHRDKETAVIVPPMPR